MIFVAVATGFFGYYAQFLSIDASAETLLLENDVDLKLTREVHGRYISPDYLVVAFSPKEYMLSETTMATIKALKESLLQIKGVESVTTLLDVPLLESPPRAVSEVVKNVRTLSSPDINKTMVQKELTSSPLYAKNLVSDDFKTTAVLVNLKEDAKYTELLQKRNVFIELQQKRELSKEEKKEFESSKKAFKEYGYSTRDEVHQL
ncbi:MAG: RND family transporter, partial [Campylobacterota bacterium]